MNIQLNFKIKIEQSYEKVISFAIILLIFQSPILSLINAITNYLGLRIVLDTVIIYGYLLLLTVIAFQYIVSKPLKKDCLLLILFFVLSLVISLLINNDLFDYINIEVTDFGGNIIYRLIFAFSTFFLVRYLDDYKKLLNLLLNFAPYIVFFALIRILIETNHESGFYLPFSYSILTCTLSCLLGFFIKNNKIYLICFLLGLALILLLGSRGALVCCLAGSIIILYSVRKNLNFKLIILLFTILIIFIFLLILYSRIDVAFSRTLNMLISRDFFSDSGRFEIIETLYANFNILGSGIYSERIFINTYPHNIFVEFLFQYGLLIGIFLCISLLLLLKKGCQCKDQSIKYLVILLLSAGFFKLLFSSSYANGEIEFFMLLALCITASQKKKDVRVCESF